MKSRNKLEGHYAGNVNGRARREGKYPYVLVSGEPIVASWRVTPVNRTQRKRNKLYKDY